MVGLVWGSVFKISFFSIPVIFFKFGVESAKMEVAIDLRLNLLISWYLFCMTIETQLNDGLSVTCTNKFKRKNNYSSLKYTFLPLVASSLCFIPHKVTILHR